MKRKNPPLPSIPKRNKSTNPIYILFLNSQQSFPKESTLPKKFGYKICSGRNVAGRNKREKIPQLDSSVDHPHTTLEGVGVPVWVRMQIARLSSPLSSSLLFLFFPFFLFLSPRTTPLPSPPPVLSARRLVPWECTGHLHAADYLNRPLIVVAPCFFHSKSGYWRGSRG